MAFVALCVAVAALVASAMQHYLVSSFVDRTGSETATALGLVDSFVATYAANYDRFEAADAPVPATFRAHALARYASERPGGSSLRVRMVGMPHREIVTPPSDAALIEALDRLDRAHDRHAFSALTAVDGERLLRTILPSIASQASCVECHNRLQPDARWNRDDMMGALVVDIPAEDALARFLRDALLAGVATFLGCYFVGRLSHFVVTNDPRALRDRLERESHARLSGAIESLAAGVAVFDRNDRLVVMNPAFRSLHRELGDVLSPDVPYETLVRATLTRRGFDTGADRTDVEAYVAERLRRHRDPGEPLEHRLADGSWEQIREQRLADGGTAVIVIDITREKERETALQAALSDATEAAAQQQRFVSVVAHEFRTPLTIIDGAAQRLARGAGTLDGDQIRERAGKIRTGIARMAALIDTLLNSARMDAGRIEPIPVPVDLVAFVEAAVRRFEGVAEQFAIRFVSDVESLTVNADPALLEHIIGNLLSNAIKYSGASRRVDLSLRSDEGEATLAIRDYGIGIAAEDLDKLFTRFYRAGTAKGLPGTGIGLHLAQELAHLQGGSIRVESAVGAGATFTVVLPIPRDLTRRADATAAPSASEPMIAPQPNV